MLSETAIRLAKPAAKARKLFGGGGLYLLLTPAGGKLWRFKYRFGGREKLLALGAYPGAGLKQARAARDDARRLLAAGTDPGAQRKAAKAAWSSRETDSFEAVAREWFGKFSAGWAASHAATIMRRLERDVFPWLSTRPAREITPLELLSVLRRVEGRGTLETAHRIHQICGQVFRRCSAMRSPPAAPSATLAWICAAPCRRCRPGITRP
jgi:Arm DNA-binding domain